MQQTLVQDMRMLGRETTAEESHKPNPRKNPEASQWVALLIILRRQRRPSIYHRTNVVCVNATPCNNKLRAGTVTAMDASQEINNPKIHKQHKHLFSALPNKSSLGYSFFCWWPTQMYMYLLLPLAFAGFNTAGNLLSRINYLTLYSGTYRQTRSPRHLVQSNPSTKK